MCAGITTETTDINFNAHIIMVNGTDCNKEWY